MTLREIFEYNFLNIGSIHLTLLHVLTVVLILLGSRILLSLINRALKQYFVKNKIDTDRQFALVQFLKYIIYTAAPSDGYRSNWYLDYILSNHNKLKTCTGYC
ncbi:MAG: hypothetical protein ACI8X3_003381 [Saprospiraceae bacterium]|jgi:hypothetical protein